MTKVGGARVLPLRRGVLALVVPAEAQKDAILVRMTEPEHAEKEPF